MKKFLHILLWAVVSVCLWTTALGQTPGKNRPWEYWGKPDGYLDQQADVLFDLIDKTLLRNPATTEPSPERQLALASLDALVHDTWNDGSPALHAFLDKRMTRVAEALQKPFKKKGIELFKLYNDGFIVRAGGATVGFDLCGTRQDVKYIPDALMRELVGRCDLLFVSHRDPDHADKTVIDMACELGVPVYAPEDYLRVALKGYRPWRANGYRRGAQ